MVTDDDITAIAAKVIEKASEKYAAEHAYDENSNDVFADPDGGLDSDWVTEAFEWFNHPKTKALETMCKDLDTLALAVDGSGAKSINGDRGLDSTFGDWESEAVDIFKERFAEGIPIAIQSQANMVQHLAHMVDAALDVIQKARESAVNVGEETIKALEEEASASDIKDLIVLTGAFASLCAATAGSGPVGVLALSAMGSSISFANSAIAIPRDTSEDILEALKTDLGAIKTMIGDGFDKVAKQILENQDLLWKRLENVGSKGNSADGTAHHVRVPRPGVLDETIDYDDWDVA